MEIGNMSKGQQPDQRADNYLPTHRQTDGKTDIAIGSDLERFGDATNFDGPYSLSLANVSYSKDALGDL